MRKNKRAQGMSINTIIIMVLALVVLAVLLFLTYKYVVKPGEQAGAAGTCTGQRGYCADTCKDTERGLLGLGCVSTGTPPVARLCCVPK